MHTCICSHRRATDQCHTQRIAEDIYYAGKDGSIKASKRACSHTPSIIRSEVILRHLRYVLMNFFSHRLRSPSKVPGWGSEREKFTITVFAFLLFRDQFDVSFACLLRFHLDHRRRINLSSCGFSESCLLINVWSLSLTCRTNEFRLLTYRQCSFNYYSFLPSDFHVFVRRDRRNHSNDNAAPITETRSSRISYSSR
jgi:hypothetical protein